MFDKKTYKKIIILILALTMIFGTVVLAAEGIYKQKLTASYGRIKFNYEGRDITDEIGRKYGTPAFTVDGRAYAPVRSLADLLDIDIDYDQETDTVRIIDPIVEEYEKKLNEKDKEIRKFRRELNKLKGIDGEDSLYEILEEIEVNLNEKYKEYGKLEFDIVLREDRDSSNNISIQVDINLSQVSDRKNWINMKHGDKKALIEDLVFQVRELLPEYDIKGNISDLATRDDLFSFNQRRKGKLNIINKDYVNEGYYYDKYYDFSDNEKNVKKEVENRFGTIKIFDAILYRLDYISKTAFFEIKFSNEYKEVWEDLDQEEIEEVLGFIAEKIELDNEHIERIYGEVWMGVLPVGKYEKGKR